MKPIDRSGVLWVMRLRSSFVGLGISSVSLAVACSRPASGALPSTETVSADTLNAASVANAAAVPILVELFSSEGCSSCPAGERALGDLLDHPPEGTRIVALEEHVDYWDYLGHVDRFGSGAFTARQKVYASELHSSSIYTPEAIVDGQHDMVGSRTDALSAAIRDAATKPHAQVAISMENCGGSKPGHVRVKVGAWPASLGDGAAKIFFAEAERRPSTKVEAGENAGSTLRHTWVARRIVAIGDVGKAGSEVVSPELAAGTDKEIVVFVARTSDGAILGSNAIAVD